MKKLIIAFAAIFALASSIHAERYVMVTHGEGKDPFWPVVQKGGEDAARAVGADFEYIFTPSGDMALPPSSQLLSSFLSRSTRWDSEVGQLIVPVESKVRRASL